MTSACTTDVSVVIVSFNVRDLLLRCLESVRPSLDGLDADVWVVDNGACDGTWDAIADRGDVRAVRGAPSLGFARANNLALRRAGGRHVLLLNPDTELPPGGIAAMVRRIEQDESIGIIGPRLVLADGTVDPSGRRSFPTPLAAAGRLLRVPNRMTARVADPYNLTDRSERAEAFVDAVSGACMLVRREALRVTGGFDPQFFMYAEDLDLALRVRRAGWRTLYFPDVEVRHWKRESTRQREVRTRLEFYRTMWRYYRKHRSADPLVLRATVGGAIALLGVGAVARRAAARLVTRR